MQTKSSHQHKHSDSENKTANKAGRNAAHTFKLWWILVIVAVILGFWAISAYNSLEIAHGLASEKWYLFEKIYTERIEILVHLTIYTKQFAGSDTTILTLLSGLLASIHVFEHAHSISRKASIVADIEEKFETLRSMIESKPSLAASRKISRELDKAIESKKHLSHTALAYNNAIGEYEKKRHKFPYCTFASLFGFSQGMPVEIQS